MKVVDLSNNNRTPDFKVLAQHVEGAYLKATEGDSFIDTDMQFWAKNLRNAGARVGFYHFARPDGGDAKAEAQFLCHHMGKIQRRDFRPALDLERNDGGLSWHQLAAWARTFNQEVFRISGSLPILYASYSWIKSLNVDEPIGAGLWLAFWGKPPCAAPIPEPWKDYQLHQFTSTGIVKGCFGSTDVSCIKHLPPLLAHPILGRI
jgi:lysozyme